MTDLGRPPDADDIRALIESRLSDVEGKPGETVTVQLRGTPVHLPVITVPVEVLRYNPNTHRVRAQLNFFPTTEKKINADPWDSGSQYALGELLKVVPAEPHLVDPAYTKLKDDLGEHGQRDPGIVTRDGVLVNGNTRRLALREMLGPQANMRVAVLPASTNWADVGDIELDLQMATDHRREYSWVNRLVSIHEQIGLAIPTGVIASKFRSKAEMVEREHGIFLLILNLIERSRVDDDALPLVAFEDKAEPLRELARTHRKLAATRADTAEVVRETRIAAIMLDFSKTDVRYIEPGFLERYLLDELPPHLREDAPAAPVDIPGLPGVTLPGAAPLVQSARNLATVVLRARVGRGASGFDSFDQLHALMAMALDRAGRDNRVRKKRSAAPDRLRDIAAAIGEVSTDVTLARSNRTFDADAVDDAVGEVRGQLLKLAQLLSRAPGTGENVEWLIAAASRVTLPE